MIYSEDDLKQAFRAGWMAHVGRPTNENMWQIAWQAGAGPRNTQKSWVAKRSGTSSDEAV